MPFSDHLIILFKITEKYCGGKTLLNFQFVLESSKLIIFHVSEQRNKTGVVSEKCFWCGKGSILLWEIRML